MAPAARKASGEKAETAATAEKSEPKIRRAEDGRPACRHSEFVPGVGECTKPEVADGVGLCGGHFALRPDLRREASRV
jgi:hypothetical protein